MHRGILLWAALVCGCSSSGGGGGVADAGIGGGSGSGGGGSAGAPADVHCITQSDGCFCTSDSSHTYPDSQGLAVCNSESPLGAHCCAGATYPEFGDCECRGWGCVLNAAGCYCSDSSSDEPAKSCPSSQSYCCATMLGDEMVSCSCSTSPGCGTGMKVVSSCAKPETCPAGTSPTLSCKGELGMGGTSAGGGGTGGGGGTMGGTGGGTSGAGGSGGTSAGGSGGTTGGSPCSQCLGAKCPSEISACGASPDCKAVIDCMSACTSDACVTSCAKAHPTGFALFTKVADCGDLHCALECL